MSRFPPDEATRLRDARTVRIETTAGAGRPTHAAIIWIAVDDGGRAYVRSWLGERGRWYRELIANPIGAVLVDGRRIPVRATPADAGGIATCSRLLAEKHRTSRASLASMLRDEVLPTTLELVPA
jgi:hypothetical protein